MTANTPREAYDAAVSRLVDALEAGDRGAAVVALADAQAFEPPDVHLEAAHWVEQERKRVVDLSDELDAEPRGWGRRA